MPFVQMTDDMIKRHGRKMTLRRRQGAAWAEVECVGVLRVYRPDQMIGGAIQGDARIIVSATPMKKPLGLAPPRKGDLVVDGGRTWAIQGVTPRMVGADVASYDMWVRGG